MIADIMTNKKFQAIIKELFIRCRKLYISLVFITQTCFTVPRDVRLNSTNYLIMRIMKIILIYENNFLTIDTTLPASDSLRFTKNLFDCYKNDSN